MIFPLLTENMRIEYAHLSNKGNILFGDKKYMRPLYNPWTKFSLIVDTFYFYM